MALKLPDSAVPMGDFPVAKAVDIDFNDGENLQEKLDNGKLGGGTVDLSGYAKSFTSLNELELTADATFQDVVDALPKGGSALLGVTEFTNYQTIFPYEEGNDQFARVHVVKGTEDGSRVYARWFRKDGVKEAIAIFNINDNKFNGWQQVVTANKITDVLTNNSTNVQVPNAKLVAGEIHGKFINLEDYSDALRMPSGKWRVDSDYKASLMQNLPVPEAGILEVKYLHGNDGANPFTATFKYSMLTYTTINGGIYKRSFNSNITAGQIVNDTGWEKIAVNDNRVTTLETRVSELFQSVSDGKTLVANAITDRGVSTPTTATFATMATNISKIPQTTPWKEETVSTTPNSTTHIAKFIFSNTVLGVRQLIAPDSNHTPQLTGTKMFTINGNVVDVKVESGTWEMTAMVWNSTLT